MRYYYYPLCSQDFTFENIFASESVSPPCFYPARGYGIDYFHKIPKVHIENAIVLFNEPPRYEVDIRSDAVKFILKIDESAIDFDGIISVSENIIGYQKTIYLNKANFQILFFTEKEKKLTLLRSETSLPTKSFRKFEANFDVISPLICKDFNLSNLSFLQLNRDSLEKELIIDRRFNYFKGFLYGVIVGLTNEKSSGEIDIKRTFREIINSFAELKNRFENTDRGTTSYYSKGITASNLSMYERKLLTAVNDSEKLFKKLFQQQGFSEHSIAKCLFEIFSPRFGSIEDAQKFIDHSIVSDQIFGTSHFIKLRSYLNENSDEKDITLYFNIIRNQIEVFLNSSRYSNSSKNKETANDAIKESLFELTRFVDKALLSRNENNRIELDKISFDPIKNQVKISQITDSVDEQTVKEVTMINNCILKYSKTGRGQAPKETILEIVKEVSNLFTKKGQSKLFQYLNNEITNYSFETVSSIPMRNFIAFAFNPDSVEKLDNFIDAKYIAQRWIAYSFWGSFNGFANLSGGFVNPVFDSKNDKLQIYIDAYLQSIYKDLSQNIQEVHTVEVEKSKKAILNEITNIATDKITEFYNLFISDKFQIPFDEFQDLIQIDEKDKFSKELKSRYGIVQKEGKKIFQNIMEIKNSSALF